MDLLYKAQTRFLFHAHIKIKLSAFYNEDIFDELFAVLEDIDKNYNSYKEGSYIDQINKNAGSFVEVNTETIDILKQVIALSDLFNGEYDITIMPLIRLWGFYKDEQQAIPSIKAINKTKQYVNYKNIEIEKNRIFIAPGQEIITGSFIKSYAVDKLIIKMQEIGINDAIINAGGSTIRAINNEGHPAWHIVVRNPSDENILYNLNIANQCYSTSSQAKTFIDINGQQFGHILSPKTGYPSQNKQIGIITDNCMLGDIISTGLYNQNAENFLNIIDSLRGIYGRIEGFMIDKENNVISTKGFEQYTK